MHLYKYYIDMSDIDLNIRLNSALICEHVIFKQLYTYFYHNLYLSELQIILQSWQLLNWLIT